MLRRMHGGGWGFTAVSLGFCSTHQNSAACRLSWGRRTPGPAFTAAIIQPVRVSDSILIHSSLSAPPPSLYSTQHLQHRRGLHTCMRRWQRMEKKASGRTLYGTRGRGSSWAGRRAAGVSTAMQQKPGPGPGPGALTGPCGPCSTCLMRNVVNVRV